MYCRKTFKQSFFFIYSRYIHAIIYCIKIIYKLISNYRIMYTLYIQSAFVGIDLFIFKTNRVMQNSVWNNTVTLYTIIQHKILLLLKFYIPIL